MVMIISISGLVVVYVAFPYRKKPVPVVPWLGQTMDRITQAIALRMDPGTRSLDRSPVHTSGHYDSSATSSPAELATSNN